MGVGVGRRTAAVLIDVVPVAAIWLAMSEAVTLLLTRTMVAPLPTDAHYDAFWQTVGVGSLVAVAGIYFTLSWWRGRTVGMALLGIEVLAETSGTALRAVQIGRRYLALYGWTLLLVVSAATGNSAVRGLVGLIALVWVIRVITSTKNSPTQQGLHDRFAHSRVTSPASDGATRRGRRRVPAVALAVALVFVAGYVGLTVAGGMVPNAVGGQVRFGTVAPNGCDYAEGTSEFPGGTRLYWVAYLAERVPAGTMLVIDTSENGQPKGSSSYATPNETDCLATTTATDPLPSGTFSVRILRDSAVEAEGTATLR
jgi:uncharacterized RDD family membrane protein YckC